VKHRPLLVMLAGPNGAGKTTFYEAYLSPLGLPFLNADILARETGLSAYEAASEIASLRDKMVERKERFILESVFSDPVGDKVSFLQRAAVGGFDVHLIFIGIPSANFSRRRVEARVGAGGHSVPAKKIRERFPRVMDNLEKAIRVLPSVRLYDNSSCVTPHRLVADFRHGRLARRGIAPAWARRFLE